MIQSHKLEAVVARSVKNEVDVIIHQAEGDDDDRKVQAGTGKAD